MHSAAVTAVTLLLLAASSCRLANANQLPRQRQLLLVSMDGFRHDYMDKYADRLPFLRQFAKEGVFVKKMQPAFTTKTFATHWTIVTGRHEESHGIVSNSMYDPVFNATFKMTTLDERWWNDSKPIWISAKQQGLKSATFFWPGSEVAFNGLRPDHYFKYDKSVNYAHRIRTVVKWLVDEQIDLCTLYFSEPDGLGHRKGPNSEEVATKLGELDAILNYLVSQLQRRGYGQNVDIIITSDHGMSESSRDYLLHLNSSLDNLVMRYIDQGAMLSMFAKPGMQQQLYTLAKQEVGKILQQLPQNNRPEIEVYSRQTMPTRFHYTHHRRIPDVLLLVSDGWLLFAKNVSGSIIGHHGYDNNFDTMSVPFIGVGPSFQRGVELQGFRQVDIYGLMCRILQLQPQPHNGSDSLLPLMLNSAAQPTAAATPLLWLLAAAAAAAAAAARV